MFLWSPCLVAQSPFQVTALSPASKVAGSSPFTLTVFVTQAAFSGETQRLVVFGTTVLAPTTSVANQYSVTISSALIATPGTIPVTVRVVAGGKNNDATPQFFQVTGPQPQITSLSPSTKVANSGDFTLNVLGSGFSAGAQVIFGSSTLTPSSVTGACQRV